MNEIQKIISSFILLVALCTGFFFAGYLFHNKRTIEQLNRANQQLEEQQRKYEELIRTTDERIRNLRAAISGQVSSNQEATNELSKLIGAIQKQKLNL